MEIKIKSMIWKLKKWILCIRLGVYKKFIQEKSFTELLKNIAFFQFFVNFWNDFWNEIIFLSFRCEVFSSANFASNGVKLSTIAESAWNTHFSRLFFNWLIERALGGKMWMWGRTCIRPWCSRWHAGGRARATVPAPCTWQCPWASADSASLAAPATVKIETHIVKKGRKKIVPDKKAVKTAQVSSGILSSLTLISMSGSLSLWPSFSRMSSKYVSMYSDTMNSDLGLFWQ